LSGLATAGRFVDFAYFKLERAVFPVFVCPDHPRPSDRQCHGLQWDIVLELERSSTLLRFSVSDSASHFFSRGVLGELEGSR